MQTIIQRGQIWNAMVPFNNQPIGKDRPVVILGWSPFLPGEDHNILVAPVYSFGGDPSKALKGDILLSNAASCGLRVGSHVRSRRLWSLHPDVIRLAAGPLGTLNDADFGAVLTEVSKLFSVNSMQVLPYS